MKGLNTLLNIIMGSFFGVFIGDLIANYRHYQQFHEIYDATNSAPWYYRSFPSLILFITVVIVCVVIKLIAQKSRISVKNQDAIIAEQGEINERTDSANR